VVVAIRARADDDVTAVGKAEVNRAKRARLRRVLLAVALIVLIVVFVLYRLRWFVR